MSEVATEDIYLIGWTISKNVVRTFVKYHRQEAEIRIRGEGRPWVPWSSSIKKIRRAKGVLSPKCVQVNFLGWQRCSNQWLGCVGHPQSIKTQFSKLENPSFRRSRKTWGWMCERQSCCKLVNIGCYYWVPVAIVIRTCASVVLRNKPCPYVIRICAAIRTRPASLEIAFFTQYHHNSIDL